MHIHLNPSQVFRVLLLGIVLLLAADISGKFIGHVAPDARGWVRIFKLDREASIATWMKSAELAACALLLAGIALHKRRERDEFRYHWLGLAIVFALLSIEEIICIHESINEPLQRLLQTKGPLYFAWIIPGAVFVAVLGFLYWRFILRFPADLQAALITSGVLYVGGVLGMESLAGWWMSQHNSRNFVYASETIVEEGMQMLGALVFLNVLMRYAARLRLEFSLRAAPEPIADVRSSPAENYA